MINYISRHTGLQSLELFRECLKLFLGVHGELGGEVGGGKINGSRP